MKLSDGHRDCNGDERGAAGFTLMEMLIVVAIIAVIVEITIPILTSHLEKARENARLANRRAAKASTTTQFFMADKDDPIFGTTIVAVTMKSSMQRGNKFRKR